MVSLQKCFCWYGAWR